MTAMNRQPLLTFFSAVGAFGLAALAMTVQISQVPAVAATPSPQAAAAVTTPAAAQAPDAAHAAAVARGKYLVSIMVCNDCHTPWKMTPKGPEPDMARMLSGHPQDVVVTGPPKLGESFTWAGSP